MPSDSQAPFSGQRCRTCGTGLNTRFCISCGTDSLCPQCGTLVVSPFCTNCGAKGLQIGSSGQRFTSDSIEDLSDVELQNVDPVRFAADELTESTQSPEGPKYLTKQSDQRRKRNSAFLIASVVAAALLVFAVVLNSLVGPQREDSTRVENKGGESVSTIFQETTTTPVPESTTTTVPKTTTTFTGRSYCNADGIAELLGAGGFEDVPARSWEKYGLFTDDRRIKYSADKLWALAYTRYGSAPVALPRPWPTDSTSMGWLNCQSGRWVYVANAATFIPVCAVMDPEFQAAHLELLGSACL